MLKRKITASLLTWKQDPDKRVLLVKGARQVGKTYSILDFAKNNYQSTIYINFEENPAYKEIFAGDLDMTTMVKQITLRVPNVKLVPGRTLLFLDEIQSCPRARTALKFLALGRQFDVIASGSLLGINYKDVPSFPVGYVDYLEMSGLDLEEFMWANNIPASSIQDLKEFYTKRQPVPAAMHTRMLELLKEYIVVGGMPRVVQEYVTRHDFVRVLRLQRGILSDYEDDIAKYALGAEKTKARACFLSLPRHLAKDYKKFRYSLVEAKGTARKFGGSLMWLYDAGIINFCHNLASPQLPLEGNALSDVFKVYLRDTGLLIAMLEDGTQIDIMDGRLGVYKGAVYENIIADIFAKGGKRLYYFEHNSQFEIDFFIRWQGKATAVEVKAANSTKAKSLTTVLQNYGVEQGIKLSAQNLSVNGAVLNLPLYMAMFL
jgi:predicted AAA+ superfamily ATPase